MTTGFTNLFVILRGIPGSGKSSLANCIRIYYSVEENDPDQQSVYVLSADDYFCDRDGDYFFVASNLGKAHADCYGTAADLVAVKVPRIVLDNTNIKLSEYEKYRTLAENAGYKVVVIRIEVNAPDDFGLCIQRNTHNVPVSVMKRRNEEVEEDSSEHLIQIFNEED